MDITSILSLISDYGVAIVIVAVFLYICVRLANIFLRKLEGNIDAKKHDKLIDLRNDINEKIQNLLDDALKESNCDRLQVIEFSNSVVSVAYLPFKYMTCMYEVHRFDKSGNGHRIDRISTSLFTTFFSKLQSNPYCIFDINDRTNRMGGAMYDLMKESGETKSLCAMMKTSRGKAIGYITMKKSEAFTADDIERIQSLAEQISVLLSVVDK